MDSKVKRQILSELHQISENFSDYLRFMKDSPNALYDNENLDIWYNTILDKVSPSESVLFQYTPNLSSAIIDLAIQMFSIKSNLFEVENIIMDPIVGEAFKFRGFDSFDSSGVSDCFNNVYLC